MNREDREPDHPSKPDSLADITKPSWLYVLRKTVREFSTDQCTDLAATLTYYAILALFPAAIALMSLVGVFGLGSQSIETLLGILSDVGASSVADTLQPVLETLSQTPGAGLTLTLGFAGALWSASGYVRGFGRAMNRIYEVDEGRPIWKLYPTQLLLTLVLIILAAITLTALVVSGPLVESVGDALGVGPAVVLTWQIAKWPVLAVVVIAMVALLYYATPNVKQPKFRWLSIGAVVAIFTWILVSVGFGFYVSNFSSYDKTYGALGGIIVFLLWLWITNLALLFGAELDSELERARELQAGIAAEETIQLPPRDTRGIEKTRAKNADGIRRGRALRESRGGERATATTIEAKSD